MTDRQLLITEDGSHTLYTPEFKETYHSMHGAIQESGYVFIEQGLGFYKSRGGGRQVSIFEVGFGTGLNALLCVLYAKKNNLSIKYRSIEALPLLSSEIQQLNYPDLIEDAQATEMFIKIHESSWDQKEDISLFFNLLKIRSKIQDFSPQDHSDICFFDAFAPSKQPEMWEPAILEKIYDLLSSQGIFVTYCAKGQLKRDLTSIGFEVETLPGPPGKKEMVRAVKR